MIQAVRDIRWRDSRSARGLSLSFGASVAIQLMNVATGVLIARLLGPEGRGELTAALLLPSLLAGIGSLGVAEGVTYHAARRDAGPGHLVGACLLLAALQSVILVLIGVGLAPVVLDRFDQVALTGAYLYMAFIPMSLTTLFLMGLLNGLERFRAFNALRLSYPAGATLGLLLLAVLDRFTVVSAVAAYLIAEAATLLAASVLVARTRPGRPALSGPVVNRVLTFGLKTHLSSVSSLLNERVDQLVISLFLAPVKLGLYVIAVTMTSVTALVGYSVAFVALPSVARLDPGPERRARARRFVLLTLAGGVVISAPVALFTPELIELFFGRSFLPAVDVTRVLLLAAIVLSMNRALGAVIKAVGRPLDVGVAEVIGLVATFAGLASLLPLFGLVGAGLASLFAYLVTLAWMSRRAIRELAA